MGTTLEQTLAHLRRLEESRREAGRTRAERLRARLGEAAELLRVHHGATSVWVFGSLVTDDRAPGDVDLAVSGLPPDRYFRALAELMHLFGGPVDLVRLEEASDSLRERVEQEGEAL